MFAQFSQAFDTSNHTADSLNALDTNLRSMSMLSRHHNSIQRADALVTRQWMRLSLWKLAVSRIQMSADPSESLSSILFPIQATRDLLSTISQLSVDALEAHGPGMEIKLFEFVSSLADVITCLPDHSNVAVSAFGPRDSLAHLASVLGSFRGGTFTLMPMLQERLADVGMAVPTIPRVIDVSGESNESDCTDLSLGEDDMIWQRNESSSPQQEWVPTGMPSP